MAIDPDLIDAVRRFDAQVRRLQDYGIEMQRPGWVARLQARKEAMAAMYAQEQLVRQDVDRNGILPRLIDAYCRAARKIARSYASCAANAADSGPGRRGSGWRAPSPR